MLNRVQCIGNLGADPEMRYTANGNAVTNFSVAVNERWKSKDGEQQERTEWFRVVAWNKLAENCAQYLTKGRQVYVEGRLETRSWEDQKSGEKRYMTEVIATDVKFLGSRQERDDYQPGGGTAKWEDGPPDNIDPDDLPF